MHSHRRTIFGLSLIALAACGGDSTNPVAVASVALTPANPTVELGSTLPLTATVKDAQGNALTGRTVSWSSSNAAVAAVTQVGVVSGVAEGGVTISATAGGQTGTTQVLVKYPYPAVAGSYAVSGTFDRPAAGFTGTLTLAQANRLGGALTGAVNLTFNGGVSGTAAGQISNATVSKDGAVAFTFNNTSDGSTWVFTGNASGNVLSGRHALTTTSGGTTQTFVGPWTATK